jgi:molecular chaperone GrpE
MKEKDINNFEDGNEALTPENGSDSSMNINADSDVPGTSYMDESLNNDSEIQKLQAEVAELKDKYLRQVAEFDNFVNAQPKKNLILSRQRARMSLSHCSMY